MTGGLDSVFETTTRPVSWIKVTAEYPETATTALKTHFGVFCSCGDRNKITKWAGHKPHTLGVIVSYYPETGPPGGRKTSPGPPLTRRCGELYFSCTLYLLIFQARLNVTMATGERCERGALHHGSRLSLRLENTTVFMQVRSYYFVVFFHHA